MLTVRNKPLFVMGVSLLVLSLWLWRAFLRILLVYNISWMALPWYSYLLLMGLPVFAALLVRKAIVVKRKGGAVAPFPTRQSSKPSSR